MRDPGTRERREDVGVGARQRAHQSQLPPRGRKRGVVAAVHRRRAYERVAGRGLVAEQQVGLALRCRGVVRALVAPRERVEGSAGELPRRVALTGREAQRGGVDGRVVAAGARVDRPVQLARVQHLGAPRARGRSEREILGDAGAERCDVLVVARLQPVALEARRGLVGGAGACQRQHRAVLEPEVVRTLRETLFREVDRGQ